MASERYSVVIIQVFLQILYLCHAGRNYHIIAPHNIRSNSIYSVVISMYAINRTCEVKVSITGALFKSSQIVYVEPRSVKQIDFTPPELKHGEYTLSAVATSGLRFDYAIKLNAIDAYNVYVQTDKTVYKPRDLVTYHVLCVDEKTRALDKVVSMVITDGAASVVEDIQHIQLVNGAYTGTLQLTKRAAVGIWSLRVKLGGTEVELKTFQVLKVSKASAEGGEFKVTIDTPFEVALPDKVLPIRVLAYYENRTPVKGTATVTLQVKGKTDHNELVTLRKTVTIDGVATVNFNTVFDLIQAYDALTLYFEITASVTNTEEDTETATSHVNVHLTHTYEITAIDMPTTFAPNETLIFEYAITYQNNLRIAANTPITMALVDAIGGRTLPASPIPATDGATFTFRVEIPEHFKADQVYAQLKIGDNVSRSDVLERGLLVAENFDPLKPYNTHFTVSHKGGISDIVYTIVSVDQIVESGYIKTPKKGGFDFQVLQNLTESDVLDMGIVDSSYLYLHYFVCNKLVYQKRKLFQTRNKHIGNTLSNFIALYHSVIDDEIILSFVTQSDSFVGILASEDASTSGNPLEDMNEFMRSVSEVGRLVTMTDATFNDGPLPNKPKQKPIRKRVDEDGIPIIWYFAGYQNTQMSSVLVDPVPNWSKRWMVSAYSLHPRMGFAYSKVLLNKYPLVNVSWPESVESGTTVVVPVTLYNNEQETRDIRLYVYDLNNIELVTRLPANYTLPAYGNKTESLNFRVTESGSVKVSIEAVSDEFQQYVNKMSTTTSGSGNNTKSPKEANTDKPPTKADEGAPTLILKSRILNLFNTTPATRPPKKKFINIGTLINLDPEIQLRPAPFPEFPPRPPPLPPTPPPSKKKPPTKESEEETEGSSSETGTGRKPKDKPDRPSVLIDDDEHIDLPLIKDPKVPPPSPPPKKKPPTKENEDKREGVSSETITSKEADDKTDNEHIDLPLIKDPTTDDKTEGSSSEIGTTKMPKDKPDRPIFNNSIVKDLLIDDDEHIDLPLIKDPTRDDKTDESSCEKGTRKKRKDKTDPPLWPPRPPPPEKIPPKKGAEDKTEGPSTETANSKEADDKTEGPSRETATTKKPKDKTDAPPFPPRPPPQKKKPKHYHVIAPYNIRSNSNYSLQIAVLASVKCKVKVTIAAASSSFSVSKVVTVGPRSVSKVDFELAELGQGEHTLSAVSTSGIEFDHKMPLNVIEGYNVFVQTDKAVYHPGDLVLYHVLCVDEKTRPKATNTPLSIELTELQDGGASNSPVSTSTINLLNGAYTGEFQLSEAAAVGNWSVKVKIDQTIVEDITIQVLKIPHENVVGPVKFTVVIDVPADVTITDRVLQFRVLAYFAHGTPVEGKATITLEVAETQTADNELVSLVKVVDIDGVVTVDLNAVFELMQTFDAPVFPVRIKAAVEHAVSREIETATTNIRVHRTHSYRITPIDIPFTFTLNESLTFIYSITYANSMVIDAGTSVTMRVVAAKGGLTIPAARIPEIDASMYTFRVEIPQNFPADQVYAQLKIGDNVSRTDVLERGVSVAENFDPLKPYNTHFNVSQADEICDIVYTIVSGDQIVESGYIKVPKQGSFDFQVLPDMSEEDLLEMGLVDSSFLHMYYFVGDKLVLQKRRLFRARNKQIANTLSNFILLYHSVFDDSMSISFVTQSDSFVGILGSEDVSTSVQAFDDLHEFMKSVSEVGGLLVMTDGVFNDTVLPKIPKQKPKRKAVHEEKIRKTWFFKSYQNSKASLGLVPSLPDWSKPWLVTAYSLHPRMGFAYSRFPMKVKYPLVTVAWPQTDTSLDFPLTLHNREEQSRSIRWLIYDVQNMQLLSEVTGNVKLDANDIKTEFIRFRSSNKRGKFNFKVQAVSDQYHQYLRKTIVAGPQHQSSYVNTTSVYDQDDSRSNLVEMSEAARKRLLNFLLNVTAVKNS